MPSRTARRWRASMPTPCAICRARYPDDLDAATLYAESLMNLRAWKLWSLDGKPAERTEEIVAVLESVLARDPNHLGANHYYIHTVEASPTPAPRAAERDAARYAGAGRRPSDAHAGAHLRAHRRPCRRRPRQRGGRRRRPRVLQDRLAGQLLRAGVLTRTTCTSSPTPR